MCKFKYAVITNPMGNKCVIRFENHLFPVVDKDIHTTMTFSNFSRVRFPLTLKHDPFKGKRKTKFYRMDNSKESILEITESLDRALHVCFGDNLSKYYSEMVLGCIRKFFTGWRR